mmetsp:Transcript_39605/g.95665  ORF Transcript_39605/g.95665 Transcript_39605/m.95665 type:complete len:88 (+) Transcript_39605:810-1073(+)
MKVNQKSAGSTINSLAIAVLRGVLAIPDQICGRAVYPLKNILSIHGSLIIVIFLSTATLPYRNASPNTTTVCLPAREILFPECLVDM